MAASANGESTVEVNPTDSKQFSLTVFGPDKKKKVKHYFKTSTPEEMRLWIKAINAFTKNIKDDTIDKAASSFGSKGRKSRRNNEDSPNNAGKAKFCQLCKLAGAPEFVYKTHNAKDCRKKEKYERLLSGGVASRSNATKEYKKELRALNKKYKKAKKEAREYRAMKKQSSNGKRKRKYDSSDDESDDDTSVSSSDTNVSY